MAEGSRAELRSQLAQAVKIDKLNLDAELIGQAALYQLICEEAVTAVSQRDKAKFDLDRTSAKVSLFIRQNPGTFPFKLTEDSIAAAVTTNPEVVASGDAYLTAKEEADYWQHQEEVFKDRSNMLKSLVQLHISGYYMAAGEGRYNDLRAKSAEVHKPQS